MTGGAASSSPGRARGCAPRAREGDRAQGRPRRLALVAGAEGEALAARCRRRARGRGRGRPGGRPTNTSESPPGDHAGCRPAVTTRAPGAPTASGHQTRPPRSKASRRPPRREGGGARRPAERQPPRDRAVDACRSTTSPPPAASATMPPVRARKGGTGAGRGEHAPVPRSAEPRGPESGAMPRSAGASRLPEHARSGSVAPAPGRRVSYRRRRAPAPLRRLAGLPRARRDPRRRRRRARHEPASRAAVDLPRRTRPSTSSRAPMTMFERREPQPGLLREPVGLHVPGLRGGAGHAGRRLPVARRATRILAGFAADPTSVFETGRIIAVTLCMLGGRGACSRVGAAAVGAGGGRRGRRGAGLRLPARRLLALRAHRHGRPPARRRRGLRRGPGAARTAACAGSRSPGRRSGWPWPSSTRRGSSGVPLLAGAGAAGAAATAARSAASRSPPASARWSSSSPTRSSSSTCATRSPSSASRARRRASRSSGRATAPARATTSSSLTWGLGWGAALAALAGVVWEWRRNRTRALLLAIFPLILFLYLCTAGRFFARWLHAHLSRCSRCWPGSRWPAWPRACPAARGCARACSPRLLLVVLAQPIAADLRTGRLLNRDDTRVLAREFLLAELPAQGAHRGRAGHAARLLPQAGDQGLQRAAGGARGGRDAAALHPLARPGPARPATARPATAPS